MFGQTIYSSTPKPWTSPKKRSNDLGRSKFRQQVQSFVCVPPWRHVTFEFWEMFIFFFFPKVFNFVQSFVECNVSLADGTVLSYGQIGKIVKGLVRQVVRNACHFLSGSKFFNCSLSTVNFLGFFLIMFLYKSNRKLKKSSDSIWSKTFESMTKYDRIWP
jgi:hypothetical protein